MDTELFNKIPQLADYMLQKLLIGFLLFNFCLGCKAQTVVSINDKNLRFIGRVLMTDSTAELSWPSSEVKLNFKGTAIRAIIKDEIGDNYYNIIVDGKLIKVLHLENIKKEYLLAEGLKSGEHTLELFKRTESRMGKTSFYQILLPNDGIILNPPKKQNRKIEVFGNSISCGYAVEDTSGKDRGTSPYENAYLSYTGITARHLNAELHNTSKSGIGITVSWFHLIISEMYDREQEIDSIKKWNFSKYMPNLVIVNLFQNDSWIVKLKDNPEFKARFGSEPPSDAYIINAYSNFIKSIRNKYALAPIVCILGSMDASKDGSPWPGYIEKAVEGIEDKNIYTHIIPYKNSPGHPSVKKQQAMANDLISYIEKNIKW